MARIRSFSGANVTDWTPYLPRTSKPRSDGHPSYSVGLSDVEASRGTRVMLVVCVVALLGFGLGLVAHGFYRAFEDTKVTFFLFLSDASARSSHKERGWLFSGDTALLSR